MPSSACKKYALRSEEHTSELQSHDNLVCRLLLEKNHSPPTTTPPTAACWSASPATHPWRARRGSAHRRGASAQRPRLPDQDRRGLFFFKGARPRREPPLPPHRRLPP